MVSTLLQWTAAGVLMLVFLFFALGNAWTLLQAWWRGHATTLALFLGGLSGTLAVLLAPVRGSARWCWVPLLLDMGTLLPTAGLLRRRMTHGLRHRGSPA